MGAGHNATAALEEAKRAASRERWGRFGDPSAEKTVEEARRKLEAEVKWAEDKLEEMRKKAAHRAGPELREHGDTEGKLADFVVLADDPHTVKVEKIKDIQIVRTAVGGATVYQA